MRREHFRVFAPRCPACLTAGAENLVAIEHVFAEHGDHIVQGTLRCPGCQAEFPVVDGVPVLVADPRTWIRNNLDALTTRDDLPDALEGVLGDAAGPGSTYDTRRSHQSSYGWGHWGDLDPEPVPAVGRAGAMLEALSVGIDGAGHGAIVDVGCALGRSTFELARRYPSRLVLGIDASFPFLRAAQDTLRTGTVRYPARRVGVVYDRRTFAVDVPRDNVDFWVADAQVLPFPAGVAGLATSLNVIDCVHSPRQHLEALRDVLGSGGSAVVATPFDWSPSATPIEHWIGGHSARGPFDGTAEGGMKLLVEPSPYQVPGLLRTATNEIDWYVRLHDRSTASYRVQVSTLRRV